MEGDDITCFGYLRQIHKTFLVLQVDAASALPATTALHWELLRKGAEILRVHDVREARQVLQLYDFYEQVLYT